MYRIDFCLFVGRGKIFVNILWYRFIKFLFKLIFIIVYCLIKGYVMCIFICIVRYGVENR